MPLNKIDYSKTIIYKIQHKEKRELFYVGHTTNFECRKYQHQKATKEGPSNFYTSIRSNGGWDMFEMVPIKQVDCLDRIAALIEEQKAIDDMKPTLNTTSAHDPNKQAKLDARIQREDEKYQQKQQKLLKKQADFLARRKLMAASQTPNAANALYDDK